MIEVSRLTKHHGETRVLADVSLEVKRGEVAGIIGPSGGGKSTLLRCINALEPFQEGSISVGEIRLEPARGAKPTREDLMQLRRRIGMVFQQFNLFPHMTALGNVMAGPRFVLGLSADQAESVARELLRRVDLANRADARPDQLSGGQQQRVAIARALAVNPEAILFDEPTSALDPRMADEVLSVITDLARAGQTMIVVTHAMHFARKVAHRLHVMSQGAVVEEGPPEEIFQNPRHEVTRTFLRQAAH